MVKTRLYDKKFDDIQLEIIWARHKLSERIWKHIKEGTFFKKRTLKMSSDVNVIDIGKIANNK